MAVFSPIWIYNLKLLAKSIYKPLKLDLREKLYWEKDPQ
jgi:hypothetical protein